jgi:hypothetical protein
MRTLHKAGKGAEVRRFMMLGVVFLLMTAMLAANAGDALALGDGSVRLVRTPSGVAVNPAACKLLVDDSTMFGWRPGGVCWFTPPL